RYKRLKISFLIPVFIVLFSTLFKIGSFFMNLLITFLEIFLFWALIVFFIELFINLNITERQSKWKETAFATNIAILPLFLTGCLLPAVRNWRDIQFPSNNDWETMQSLSENIGYQILVQLPNIIAITTIILIILMLAIAIHEVHEVEYLKSILFATTIGILAFTISTVIAGIPFGMV
ncbi:MAG: hypothetical protein ACTSQJ_13660, partial [Promethearchaeota archaeon]